MNQRMLLPDKRDPPLKWTGGKRWFVPHLQALRSGHEHRRLVFPFCGGLGDVMGLWPQHALLNDVNQNLIAFYKLWQIGLDASDKTLFSDDPVTYLENRKRFNELNALTSAKTEAELKETALLFYYLLRSCFNGLCRFNQKGEFNVGYGVRSKPVDYAYWLTDYRIPYGWTFTQGDFSFLRVNNYSCGNILADMIVCDPPYDGTFTGYSADGFGWDKQEALIQWLHHHEGPVVITNAPTPRIIELYQDNGYALSYLDAQRTGGGKGSVRGKATEVIATKNLAGSHADQKHSCFV